MAISAKPNHARPNNGPFSIKKCHKLSLSLSTLCGRRALGRWRRIALLKRRLRLRRFVLRFSILILVSKLGKVRKKGRRNETVP